MEYPRVDEQYDATCKSEGINRIITVISIADEVFADVMTVQKENAAEIGLQYVMQNSDGGTAYFNTEDGDSAGNVEDYGCSENELVQLASKYIGWTEDGNIAPLCPHF